MWKLVKSRIFLFPMAILFMIFVIIVFYDFSLNYYGGFRRFSSQFEGSITPLPVVKMFIQILALLLGVIAGSIYRKLESVSDHRVSLKTIGDAMLSPGLVRSIVGAPILFVSVYASAKIQPDLLAASLFAFENGFFCDVILNQREKTISRNTKENE